MRNLLIYINPGHDFGLEEKVTVKIQIDNSLDLGWKRQDLILVTNFPYEYMGVRSKVVSDKNYCPFCPQVSKINAIIDLFNQKLIKRDNVYWFHDLDAFQLVPFTEPDLNLDETDLLMPEWGRLPRWATGSFFFNKKSKNIFTSIREIVYKCDIDEEDALGVLTRHEFPDKFPPGMVSGHTTKDISEIGNINGRVKRLNISYNFHTFNIRSNYASALKPIRVAHFHPLKPINPGNPKSNQIDFFLKGVNKLNVRIVPERLVKIFNKHGIK